MKLVLSDNTTAAIIWAWRNRIAGDKYAETLPPDLEAAIYKDMQAAFREHVKREGDPCPFCSTPVVENSFSSSYGSPDTTTWTIDLFCRSCQIKINIHTSSHVHTSSHEDNRSEDLE